MLWGVLVVPPVRHALEATMSLHMLVQIPLLVVAGWLVASAVPRRVAAVVARFDAGGICGLLLVSMTSLVWMLPLALDAALEDPLVAAAKFLTAPLLIGVPLALSWPRMGFVVRGVFLVEVIATAFRVGWLYLISPQRLCSNYLLGDQQQVGRILLLVGVAIGLVLAWKLLW
ncbi:MAG: hypothetical protein L0H23_07925, partial [Luteimonas sp.]|nr:hypothetical protein [Luteimonas sp.]